MSAVLVGLMVFFSLVMVAYMLRHFVLTLYRLGVPQYDPYADLHQSVWPKLVVFIAAHNEEQVVEGCLRALLACDYPRESLRIVPVDDRSTDRTGEICDRVAAQSGGVIEVFHRRAGGGGKAAAMKEATERYLRDAEVFLIFDADYQPAPQLLKHLVAPMVDPSVGVTMGRVVPVNAGHSLLTRLLDLERSSGYQVDQQARQGLGLLAQYGGTCGAIRVRAFWDIGGFHPDTLAEDTDLTLRMRLKHWRVRYLNQAECYEEVPQDWRVRMRQVKRWAKGHNEVLVKYLVPVWRSSELSWLEKLDTTMLLFVYTLAPMSLLSWVLVAVVLATAPSLLLSWTVLPLLFLTLAGFGNFAPFFQTAAAVRLDGSRLRLRLLAFFAVSYLVNAIAVTQGLVSMVLDKLFHRALVWDKTARYRQSTPSSSSSPGASS